MQASDRTSPRFILPSPRWGRFFVVLLLVSYTSLLTVRTLEIQHSCYPLLEWTEVFQQQCSLCNSPNKGDSGQGESYSCPEPPEPGHLGKEIASVAVGAVAAAGLAIAGAPIAIVAGAGFFIWLAARSLISLGH